MELFDAVMLSGLVSLACVTIRDRDTMEQVRIPVGEVRSYIEERLAF